MAGWGVHGGGVCGGRVIVLYCTCDAFPELCTFPAPFPVAKNVNLIPQTSNPYSRNP